MAAEARELQRKEAEEAKDWEEEQKALEGAKRQEQEAK